MKTIAQPTARNVVPSKSRESLLAEHQAFLRSVKSTYEALTGLKFVKHDEDEDHRYGTEPTAASDRYAVKR